mmetsp:Transcript_151150/g.264115  ORF Transcript_151150/g.264115 Transcript_151150/m.264115 type:complete len:82 (-) Transcript_151150:255-500(-)
MVLISSLDQPQMTLDWCRTGSVSMNPRDLTLVGALARKPYMCESQLKIYSVEWLQLPMAQLQDLGTWPDLMPGRKAFGTKT